MKKIEKIILFLLIFVGLFILGIFIVKLSLDIVQFDINNQDELKVIDCNYISAYKNAIYIKAPIGKNAFSFGIIVFGNKNTDKYTVRHEYGHYVQFKEYGIYKYTKYIAIPSLKGYYSGVSYYDYYSQPWEYGAEIYGNVNRLNYSYSSNVLEIYNEYVKIINGG